MGSTHLSDRDEAIMLGQSKQILFHSFCLTTGGDEKPLWGVRWIPNKPESKVSTVHFCCCLHRFLPWNHGIVGSRRLSPRLNILAVKHNLQSCDALQQQKGRVSYMSGGVFLEPVNIILLLLPPFLSSSSEVPSIKAHNPYFPLELRNGRQRAVFALGCECAAECEAALWQNICAYQNCSHGKRNYRNTAWSEYSWLDTLRNITLLYNRAGNIP